MRNNNREPRDVNIRIRIAHVRIIITGKWRKTKTKTKKKKKKMMTKKKKGGIQVEIQVFNGSYWHLLIYCCRRYLHGKQTPFHRVMLSGPVTMLRAGASASAMLVLVLV